MANKLQVLLGADPELFLTNDKGQLISAHDILPGTKTEPFRVPLGAVQVDGVAAEFNIDPAPDSKTFIRNISQVMTQLKEYCKGNKLTITPYAVFDKDYFNSLPDVVRELGCNPDFNAWTGQVNPAPDGGSTSVRTASGHIHIGWCKNVNPHSKSHFSDCCTLVKELDYYLGLYSLLWDKDNTRRQLYGKAGAFRPKEYGVEYRVMSNIWLKSPRIQDWIWHSVNAAINNLMTRKESMEDMFGDYARKTIDGNDCMWIHTATGTKIHQAVGLSIPDLSELKDKDSTTEDKLKEEAIRAEFKKFKKKTLSSFEVNFS